MIDEASISSKKEIGSFMLPMCNSHMVNIVAWMSGVFLLYLKILSSNAQIS